MQEALMLILTGEEVRRPPPPRKAAELCGVQDTAMPVGSGAGPLEATRPTGIVPSQHTGTHGALRAGVRMPTHEGQDTHWCAHEMGVFLPWF